MELQFHKNMIPGLQLVKREIRNLEETQELRLPDGMPDVGRVLGAWGQVLLRSKEWRSGSVHISGGVQVRILYLPEEGTDIQQTQAWLPFQLKWELPDLDKDGVACVDTLLRSADARSTSARKIMVRVNVGVMGEMWMPAEYWSCSEGELPEDVLLLERTYPVCMPREAGEKAFALEEELMLPASAPKMERVLYYCLQPELMDHKIMSDKVVFRGAAMLHMLYLGEDGRLHTWDFELPFSQYAELEHDYEPGATARIMMAVTSVELETDLEGRIQLRAGMTGQYLICDQMQVRTVEDAYSPCRTITPAMETMELPNVLDVQQQMVSAEKTVPSTGSTVDLMFLPDHPSRQHADVPMELGGLFQLLYRDENDELQTVAARWEGQLPFAADPQTQVMATARCSAKTQTAFDGSGTVLHADMQADVMVLSGQGLPMVTALEMGDMVEPDPDRPSLILRRAGQMDLWHLAKQYGSTASAIQEANKLDGEPAAGTMLLIPVQ